MTFSIETLLDEVAQRAASEAIKAYSENRECKDCNCGQCECATSSEPKLLTERETCAMLGCGRNTLMRWQRPEINYLKPIKIGGKNRWKLEDIMALLKGRSA